MNLLDILITYLAIGSAFAMKEYFRNRRSGLLNRCRAVLVHLFLWLPILAVRLVTRRGLVRRHSRPNVSGEHPEFEARIQGLLACFPSLNEKKRAREILERFAALDAALGAAEDIELGQFELFAISGNGNGATGTLCLYRRNLSKLRTHKLRTSEDLIRLVDKTARQTSSPQIVTQLAMFFEAFGDRASLQKLGLLINRDELSELPEIRLAA